jgi:hypothetical protein
MKNILILIITMVIFDSCSKDDTGQTDKVINGWTISFIDDVRAADADISAVCDSNNKIHVCYSDFNQSIKYATNQSGSWERINLFTAGGDETIGLTNDIAIDSDNHVHIIYTTETQGDPIVSHVYYATDASGSLTSEEVFHDEHSSSGVGIAALHNGKVHLVFSDGEMQMFYINNLNGSWSAPALIDNFWTSVRPRLATDANDNVFVVYGHSGEGVLRMQEISAAGVPGSNTVLAGDPGGSTSTGWSPSIVIHPTLNTKYISYWNADEEAANLYMDGVIEPIGEATWFQSGIALDIYGYPQFTYTMGSEDLPDEAASGFSDIAIGSDNAIHIIYPSGSTNDLRMMTR